MVNGHHLLYDLCASAASATTATAVAQCGLRQNPARTISDSISDQGEGDAAGGGAGADASSQILSLTLYHLVTHIACLTFATANAKRGVRLVGSRCRFQPHGSVSCTCGNL